MKKQKNSLLRFVSSAHKMLMDGVILNTAGEAGEAGEAGDVFSRPSYDSPGVPGGGRRHATHLSR